MSNELYAGAAKKNITCKSAQASEIRDNLYVRTLTVRSGDLLIAVLALDAVGIGWICDVSNDFFADLRQLLSVRFGIKPEHVIASATHTHPSAAAQHLNPGELLEACSDSVEEAMKNMLAVTIASGKGNEPRFTINRTTRQKNGLHWTLRHSNPTFPDEELDKLGPLDSSIGIIKFCRKDNGQAHAVLFNYACHPLWADAPNRISGNYPGIACRVLEESLPGCTAIFLQGTAGDVIDRGFKNFEQNRSEYIEIFGSMLALSTLRAMNTLKEDANSSLLDIASTKVRLPRKHDFAECIAKLDEEAETLLRKLRGCPLNLRSFMDLYLKYTLHADSPLNMPAIYQAEKQYQASESLREMDRVNKANIARYIENAQIMEQLARIEDRRETFKFHCNLNGDMPDVGAELHAIRLGDAVLVTSPTEMLTQVGLNIKAASPFENTFIAAYCNGYLHYGAPADYYPLQGYEVTECMLDPGWQAIHENAVQALLNELKQH